MDPASIVGLISASGTIVSAITFTVKGLSDLRGRYAGADLRIRLLIGELSTVKSALNQIRDWVEFNLVGAPTEAELVDGLHVSLDGCKVAMTVLAEEVVALTGTTTSNPEFNLRFSSRAKYAWSETSMREHQDRLHAQVAALQLLLQAAQCRTSAEQGGLLRSPVNKIIIQKVVDDTSSLKATMSAASSEAGRASALSQKDSAVDSKEFEWDDEIVNAATYRRALTQARSMAKIVGTTEKTDIGSEARHPAETDCSNLLLPTSELPNSKQKGKVPPKRALVVSEPVEAYLQPSSQVPQFISMSGPTLGRKNVFSLPPNVPAPERRSFWASLSITQRRRCRSAGQHVSQSLSIPTTPTSGSFRYTRGSQSSLGTSIGSSPTDALVAPAIVRAAQADSAADVEVLLDKGANIEARHLKSKRTALAVAAHCGNVDVVRVLLQYGAKVDVCDAFMMTPLHLAASRGHYLVVESLLHNLADINGKGPNDETPLRIASDNGYIDVVKLFLRNRAKVNARDCQQRTALHMAAKRGDEAMVDLLASNGAHVDAKDASFMTAIHYASEEGHDGVVNLLLSKKADINAPGKELQTPLACACSAGQTQVVELLLKKKASTKLKSRGDMNPLHLACSYGHVEVVALLLQKRLAVNLPNKDGLTPLHFAVRSDRFAVVELLLRKGASIEARCRSTFGPLHYACLEASPDVVRLLLSSGADLEAEDQSARRPLHFAVTRGSVPLVELLVLRGANTEAQDAAGHRPLCLASALGHLAMMKMLLDSGSPLVANTSLGPVDSAKGDGWRSLLPGYNAQDTCKNERGGKLKAQISRPIITENPPGWL